MRKSRETRRRALRQQSRQVQQRKSSARAQAPGFEPLEPRQLFSMVLPAPVSDGLSDQAVTVIIHELAKLDQTVYANADGSGNNETYTEWGSTDEQLLRLTSVEYGDGISTLAGEDRPSAREVSNIVADQTESTPNDRYLTNYLWLWGQFLDHDLDLTTGADPAEPAAIDVPTGDPYFDPFATGTQTISLTRSVYDPSTGDSVDNPRQQLNQITAFLDGSQIYGSDADTAAALRTFTAGQLRTSAGDLLPIDDATGFFLAGDIRANENVALTSMHTIWVREHNWWAEKIAQDDPSLSDQEIYERARAVVVAELQAITYNEFLPALLGPGALEPYSGYDPTVNPQISNIFSTAAYRLGHSLLSSELVRLDADGNPSAEGNLALRDAFFNPAEVSEHGVDSLLRGLATTLAQELDNQIIDDVRNFLFGPPGAGGFDLAALNIQRGRDHGLPDYNQARVDLGLDPVTSFADISSDPDVQARLEAAYGSVDDIDVWVGALAEDHLPGSSVGELLFTVLSDQFSRIRAGDRFWYQNTYTGKMLGILEHTTLSQVIMRNSEVTGLQDNIFLDDSVMVVKLPEGRRPGNITVVVKDGNLEVRDGRKLIQSRAAEGVERLLIEGVDHRADRVTLDLRQGDLDLPGGVLINGGAGRGDVLTINAGRAADQVVIGDNAVTFNGTTMRLDGIETVMVNTGGRNDDVTLAGAMDARVIVRGSRAHGPQLARNDVNLPPQQNQQPPRPQNNNNRQQPPTPPQDDTPILTNSPAPAPGTGNTPGKNNNAGPGQRNSPLLERLRTARGLGLFEVNLDGAPLT